MAADLRRRIESVLKNQNGIIFARSAIVSREMYCGRNIVSKNSGFEYADERGYLPVEWWIMSLVEAQNGIMKKDEGLTELILQEETILFRDALKYAERELMGEYASQWPLTKVLDIGGSPKSPKYSSPDHTTAVPEVPPIPAHVHSGNVVDGCFSGQGKTEAYFFPPLDVPPYNLNLEEVSTRLGLKKDVTEDIVLKGMNQFGHYDDMYACMEVYPLRPWETWHIDERVVHAPGPWLTFEIQRPQDDFNFLAWQLGTQLAEEKIEETKESLQLRGLRDTETLLRDAIDWEKNVDKDFKSKWWNKCEILEQGDWGQRYQLFYHCFYGEGIVVNPRHQYTRNIEEQPFAGLVWSGSGKMNQNEVAADNALRREFLVTPKRVWQVENMNGRTQLIIFCVFPMRE